MDILIVYLQHKCDVSEFRLNSDKSFECFIKLCKIKIDPRDINLSLLVSVVINHVLLFT